MAKGRISKKLKEWAAKARDKKVQDRVKAEVKRRAAQGKAALKKVEAELAHLKAVAIKQERKAVDYAKKNPKKALAMAVAAGVVAGATLLIMRRMKKKVFR